MILDSPNILLFIEPRNSPRESDMAEFQWFVDLFNEQAVAGVGSAYGFETSEQYRVAYLGIHQCSCGEWSSSQDYRLPNNMITNSLAIHYLQYHRDEIPKSEWFKLRQLKDGVMFAACSRCKIFATLGKYKRCQSCREKTRTKGTKVPLEPLL